MLKIPFLKRKEKSRVKVHTTFWGGQYVNINELMEHPDTIRDIKIFNEVIGPIIEKERKRLR